MEQSTRDRALAWLRAASASAVLVVGASQGQGSQNPPEAPVAVSTASSVTGEPARVGVLARAISLVMALCRRFEGFRALPYLCPAGVWTIGFGATTYLDGRPVKPTDPAVSEAAGERLLERQISTVYMPATLALVPTATVAELQAALCDFCFNFGPTRLKGSTLRKLALKGDWVGVQAELRKWTRGGGKVLPGLVLRRDEECKLVAASRTNPAR